MIKSITFDFWDTIAVDDSDEAKRKTKGLEPKTNERENLLCDALSDFPRERVLHAFKKANAKFNRSWKEDQYTPKVAERIHWVLQELKIPNRNLNHIVKDFENMEVITPPDPAPGILEAIDVLGEKYELGIISDTIVTPGVGIREILKSYNVLDRFSVFVFSDEVGAAKPSPLVFQKALSEFGCSPEEMVHIGDRFENDIRGPKKVGCKSIYTRVAVDRGDPPESPDAFCENYQDLPRIIEGL